MEGKMKKLLLLIIAMAFVVYSGAVQAKDYEITKKAGDLTVLVKIDKNPPVTGINRMDITLKDTGGKNIADAVVAVEYGMPAMPGMGAMNYKSNTTLKGNLYQASVNFSMSGAWSVNIKINRGGKTQTVKLNVDIK